MRRATGGFVLVVGLATSLAPAAPLASSEPTRALVCIDSEVVPLHDRVLFAWQGAEKLRTE